MANDSEAIVKLGADVSDLKEKLKEASSAFTESTSKISEQVKGLQESVKGAMEGVTASFLKVNQAMQVFQTAMEGGEGMKKMVEKTIEMSSEASKLSKQLGITIQEAGVLGDTLHDVGSSSEQFTGMAQRLNRQVKSNEDGMNAMGVQTRNVNGDLLNQRDMMMSALQVVGGYAEGVDRNNAAMRVFGGRVGDINSMLRVNKEALQATADLQRELGSTITPQNAASARDYKDTMMDVHNVFDAVQKVIGDTMIPRLAELGKMFIAIGPSITAVIRTAMDVYVTVANAIGDVLRTLWSVVSTIFSSIGSIIGAIFGGGGSGVTAMEFFQNVLKLVGISVIVLELAFNNLATVLKGALAMMVADLALFANTAGAALDYHNWGVGWGDRVAAKYKEGLSNIKAVSDGINEDLAGNAEKAVQSFEKLMNGTAHVTDTAKVKPKNENLKHLGDEGADKKTPAPSQMPALEQELQNAKLTMARAGHIMLKEEESAYWAAMLKLSNLSTEDYNTIVKKAQGAELADLTKSIKDKLTLSRMVIDEDRKAASDDIAVKELNIKQSAELGLISKQQEMQTMADLEDAKYALAVASQMDLYALHEGDVVAQRKDLEKIEDLYRKHTATLSGFTQQIAVDQKKTMDGVMKPVESGMSTAMETMLNGTASFSKAMHTMTSAIGSAFLKMATDAAAQWIMKEVIMTTATQVWTAARTALGLEAAVVDKATSVGTAIVKVETSAAAAGAGAVASQAPIPIVGPDLAVGAFAAMVALALGAKSLFSSEGGEWNVGEDRLNLVHKNETILPAHIAGPLRDMIAGGGAAQQPTIHIHAMDAVGVKQFFTKHGATMMDTLKGQARNFNMGRA
jgi:hypothetical protein